MSVLRPDFWRETSAIPALAPAEIHVWKINLAATDHEQLAMEKLLSAEECERAARFHFAADKNRFVVRRAVLRQLLAAQLEIPPAAVRYNFSSHGKPAVANPENSGGLGFSCSHSADWALVALARASELGVDLEKQRQLDEIDGLAERFFSEMEIRELMSLPQNLKTAGFFNGWTRKEAIVKAIGLGLTFPLNRFSVTLAPDRPAALLEVADDSVAAQKWTMAALDVRPDYSAALVFADPDAKIKLFGWNLMAD
jgi:4'-phosphopantetheinyl transferase